MGKVIELIMGQDSKIRTVKVKQGNGAIECHSISNLYPLEVSVTHSGKDARVPLIDRGATGGDTQIATTARPKRKATDRFNRMLRDDIQYL